MPLTSRQRECLAAIAAHRKRTGTMPTLEEVRAALALSSTSAAHRLLTVLEQRRFIRREHYKSRGIILLEARCPHCGMMPDVRPDKRKAR